MKWKIKFMFETTNQVITVNTFKYTDVQIYTNWYFGLPPGRVFLGLPGHSNIRSPCCLHTHLNIRMELLFHDASRGSRSQSYLHISFIVVTVVIGFLNGVMSQLMGIKLTMVIACYNPFATSTAPQISTDD
jgi:hypothetical protein